MQIPFVVNVINTSGKIILLRKSCVGMRQISFTSEYAALPLITRLKNEKSHCFPRRSVLSTLINIAATSSHDRRRNTRRLPKLEKMESSKHHHHEDEEEEEEGKRKTRRELRISEISPVRSLVSSTVFDAVLEYHTFTHTHTH